MVDSSIKELFPPLKGPFEILEETELAVRLQQARATGIRRLWVALLGPESFRERLRARLRMIQEPEIILAEDQPGLFTQEALGILAYAPSPEEIEPRSFEIIKALVDLSSFPEEVHPLVLRLIHTSGDPDFLRTLVIHPEAVRTGLALLKEGCEVVVDVEMVAAGVNRNRLSALGGRLLCAVTQGRNPPPGQTRTAYGLEKILAENPGVGVVAVGNAPTALLAAIRWLRENPRPVLVIGFPVGFVRAAEAKLLLIRQPYPYITNYGPRGGSALAAAALNALIRMAHGQT